MSHYKKSSAKDHFKVLLVEDSEFQGKYYKWCLEDMKTEKIKVTLVDSCGSALKLLAQQDFHIILLDLNLSDTMGEETFVTVKKHCKDIPIVILSNIESEDFALNLLKNGAEDYLIKADINTTTLRQCVKYVVFRNEIEQEINQYQKKLQIGERMTSTDHGRPTTVTSSSEFIANISHELRSPMHGILSFAGFGIKKIDEINKDQLLDYLKKIYTCGNRLLLLLNDLLDLSKLESGKINYHFQKSVLSEIIQISINELSTYSAEKNINIDFDSPGWNDLIIIDPHRMLQVVRNLLSNAIKYSPANGIINIEIRDLSDKIQLSIIDQGVGIPEEELEGIFDKYIQSSKTRSNTEGTGLGLSICHRIINDHHGRIWAENNPDKGARLNIIIPKDCQTRIQAK